MRGGYPFYIRSCRYFIWQCYIPRQCLFEKVTMWLALRKLDKGVNSKLEVKRIWEMNFHVQLQMWISTVRLSVYLYIYEWKGSSNIKECVRVHIWKFAFSMKGLQAKSDSNLLSTLHVGELRRVIDEISPSPSPPEPLGAVPQSEGGNCKLIAWSVGPGGGESQLHGWIRGRVTW